MFAFAEENARERQITHAEQDAYAEDSLLRAQSAQASGARRRLRRSHRRRRIPSALTVSS
jgi:hypothetical protein